MAKDEIALESVAVEIVGKAGDVVVDEAGYMPTAPTAPQARDAEGNLLDEWGLPENLRLRAEALKKRRKPDPREQPEAWA